MLLLITFPLLPLKSRPLSDKAGVVAHPPKRKICKQVLTRVSFDRNHLMLKSDHRKIERKECKKVIVAYLRRSTVDPFIG